MKRGEAGGEEWIGTVRGIERGGKVRGGGHTNRNRAKVIDYEGLHTVLLPFFFLHFFLW